MRSIVPIIRQVKAGRAIGHQWADPYASINDSMYLFLPLTETAGTTVSINRSGTQAAPLSLSFTEPNAPTLSVNETITPVPYSPVRRYGFIMKNPNGFSTSLSAYTMKNGGTGVNGFQVGSVSTRYLDTTSTEQYYAYALSNDLSLATGQLTVGLWEVHQYDKKLRAALAVGDTPDSLTIAKHEADLPDLSMLTVDEDAFVLGVLAAPFYMAFVQTPTLVEFTFDQLFAAMLRDTSRIVGGDKAMPVEFLV